MGVQAERWLAQYASEYEIYVRAAGEVRKQIEESLPLTSLSVNFIEARAKDPDSAGEKIQRRRYGQPGRQFDDLIGVRIVTLFDHAVPDIVDRLKGRFSVDEERSQDKTTQLKERQVGYRGHHLVMKVRGAGGAEVARILHKTHVEVQVKSIMAHSWAEIEHSLRYKIGEGLPEELSRRFDALAGTMDLVDREFGRVLTDTAKLIQDKSSQFKQGVGLTSSMNSINLMGAILWSRPHAKALGPERLPLPIEDGFRFSKILIQCGIVDVGRLYDRIQATETREAIRRFAQLEQIEPEEASAKAVVGAVVGVVDRSLFSSVAAFAKDQNLVESLDG